MLGQWKREAEDRWLPVIKPHLEEAFSATFLPSHDLQHHLRVWSYAARLLGFLDKLHLPLDYDLVEGTLLACMFHDAGLTREQGAMHGQAGREMCDEFFIEKNLRKPARYSEMLKAIEHHDAKTSNTYIVFERGKAPGILSILSVADDLDALGITGIYRYAEIYLKRGIPMDVLGIKIMENAFTRRDNLLHCCRYLPALTGEIRRDAEVLIAFWSRYNQQLQLVDEAHTCQWGELGIINRIGNMASGDSGTGQTLNTFFNELYKDLEAGGS